jgi:hypothetical protein
MEFIAWRPHGMDFNVNKATITTWGLDTQECMMKYLRSIATRVATCCIDMENAERNTIIHYLNARKQKINKHYTIKSNTSELVTNDEGFYQITLGCGHVKYISTETSHIDDEQFCDIHCIPTNYWWFNTKKATRETSEASWKITGVNSTHATLPHSTASYECQCDRCQFRVLKLVTPIIPENSKCIANQSSYVCTCNKCKSKMSQYIAEGDICSKSLSYSYVCSCKVCKTKSESVELKPSFFNDCSCETCKAEQKKTTREYTYDTDEYSSSDDDEPLINLTKRKPLKMENNTIMI